MSLNPFPEKVEIDCWSSSEDLWAVYLQRYRRGWYKV